jgi:hypothetical protein
VGNFVPPVESYSTAILKYKQALESFWAANVLIEGLRRADRQLDTERLVDTLEGIHELELGLGTPLTFGLTEHQASHRVWGTRINDEGVYEVIDLQ